ncbi:tetratricopeptide repeat protein [Pleurocapsales cyanobacterium LEGE 06147]|nr:tetratricopeptide repeat protein [Pleurocapsales cyanobacterium LEGE 06147]
MNITNTTKLIEAYLKQGTAHAKQNEWERAISCYQKITEIDPTNAIACHHWADALLNLERWEEAIATYHRAITINPNFDWSYYNLADVLVRLERWEEAVHAYQKAFDLNPSLPSIYQKLGNAFLQRSLANRKEMFVLHHQVLRDNPHDIERYHQAIELQPRDAKLYLGLGNALVANHKLDEAIVAYQMALQLQPDYAEAQFQLDKILKFQLEETLTEGSPESNRQENIQSNIELTKEDEISQAVQGTPPFKRGSVQGKGAIARRTSVPVGSIMPLAGGGRDSFAPRGSLTLFGSGSSFEHATPDPRGLSNSFHSPSRADLNFVKLKQAKNILDNLNQIALDNFLLTNTQIHLPQVEQPQVSIILILYNRAELTLSCLYSILRNNFKSIEVILVDNCSSDRTRKLLERIQGAKIILNEENKHFLLACNQASQVATGNYLLFLNNDTQILGDSIKIALETIRSSPDIGAVGGKIILPDGTLQEAGSIIWCDGSCLGYGRGDDPKDPKYMFRREVDYCSGAFLLTSRELFLKFGGFERAYQPAYYEETDYCVKLHKAGKKIIYEPNVTILHYEFASSSCSDRAIELQKRNQQIFVERHRDWLQFQYSPDLSKILFASNRNTCRRILFIDDRIPHPYLGSGYTRSHGILARMVRLGYCVTFYPTDLSYLEDWNDIYADIDREVEIVTDSGLEGLEKFLLTKKSYYDIVFVSRPHNMNHLNYLSARNKNLLRGMKVIYDAEALYTLRQFEQRRLKGETISTEEQKKLIAEELDLARQSDCIIAVSALEKQRFIECGYNNVIVLGHALNPIPTPNSFYQRQHILFVGSIYELESPNADSILWFSKEIFSLIQAELGQEVNLLIAGNNTVEEIKRQIEQFNNDSIKMLGKVDDLKDLYNQARLFIAPTRFAAGIPHKVHEAAAYGLPVVTTSLIAAQLEWEDEIDLLVADSSKAFAQQCVKLYQNNQLWERLRLNSLKKIESQCSPEYFTKTLKQILKY